MAPAALTLRLCLRRCLSSPTTRILAAAPQLRPVGRPLSTTAIRRQETAEDRDEQYYANQIPESELTDEMKKNLKDLEKLPPGFLETRINALDTEFKEILEMPVGRRRSMWDEDEEDSDLLLKDSEDTEEFEEDDMMSMAHSKLEEHREYREYARIAAWQMPLLSKLAKPFEPPTADMPLRFRYTSYMGEYHPAESKVVVEFSPRDLPLDEAQQLKLKKLCGVRYNPETDIVKMSCEQFEHQAQNKRYLGDLVDKLIAEAKDKTDTFEDVPLDTRHHQSKEKPKFPIEWRMTEQRRLEIENSRHQSFLLDQVKEEQGSLVDGVQKIEGFLATAPAKGVAEKVPQLISAKRTQSRFTGPKEARRK